MPRCCAPVRRGDARAAIFIILGLGLFAIVGLILAIVMLVSIRKSTPPRAAVPPPPRPVAERYGGLLRYCPRDAVSVTAVDVMALTTDPKGKEITEALTGEWKRRYADQFAKVPLSVADVEAFVLSSSSGNPEEDRNLPPQDRRGVLTAIRFSRPVTEGEVLRGVIAGTFKTDDRMAPNGERYHGLYRLIQVCDHYEREESLSLRLADDRTLLIATTHREMEESIRRGTGRLELSGPLHRMMERSDGPVVCAAIGPTGPRDDGTPRYLSHRIAAGGTLGDRRAGCIWFTINADRVVYHEGFLMLDSARASGLRDALLAGLAKDAGPPPASEALAVFVGAARVKVDGDLVTVDASVTQDQFIRALKDKMAPPGSKPK